MNLDKEIFDKVKLFEQVKNHLGEIAKKMGALQEEQRATYNQGLELKGAIDILVALQQKEKEDLASSKTASLILPEGVKPVIPEAAKTVENAQEVTQYSTNLESERVLDRTLADINTALKAIETHTYGICKYCGNEIEEKRLLIRPFSGACVKCKTRLQQGA